MTNLNKVLADTAKADKHSLRRNFALAMDLIAVAKIQTAGLTVADWNPADIFAGGDPYALPRPHQHIELMQPHWDPVIPSPATIAICFIGDSVFDAHKLPDVCDVAIERCRLAIPQIDAVDPVPYQPQTNPGGPWTAPVNRDHPLFRMTTAIHQSYASIGGWKAL